MWVTAGKFLGARGLMGRWKELAMITLVAIICYQNFSDTRWAFGADTIPYLKAQNVRNEIELDLALQANERLTSAIQESNERVQTQRDMSVALEEQFSLITEEISKIRNSANQRVRTVIKEAAPDTCTAAFEYLRDAIPELKYFSGDEQ